MKKTEVSYYGPLQARVSPPFV